MGRVGLLLFALGAGCSFPVEDLRVVGADSGVTGDATDCETPSTFFFDGDGDGFGAGEGVLACEAPPQHVANALDCRDSDKDANPAALTFRPAGYDVGAAVPSFDWSCDGVEEPDPAAPLSSAGCALESGGGSGCTGEGYVEVADRTTVSGANAWCGSTSYRVCTKQTSPPKCVETLETRAPLGCR